MAHLALSASPSFLTRVVIAHFNHCLRGEEADQDEEFVRELARELDFNFHTRKWDRLPRDELARPDRNLQAAARKARYEFLFRTARKESVAVIATAHHRTDRVETILQNLARGGGMGAWLGVREVSVREGLWVVRPLIDFGSKEIRTYLKDRGILFREDSSNDSLDYTRNWVRHELLGAVVREYSEFENDLDSIARNAQRNEARWLETAKQICRETLIREKEWVLPRPLLAELSPEGRFFCLREILRDFIGEEEEAGWYPVRKSPIEDLFGLLDSARDGVVNLPQGVRAEFSGNVLHLSLPSR